MPNPVVLVTGANGHLGRLLLARLARGPEANGFTARPAVRSERAARQVTGDGTLPVDVRQVDVRQVDVRQVDVRQVDVRQVDVRQVDVRQVDVRQVDYASRKSLEEAAEGCRAVVHLVGIIKETRTARYVDAHERTCEALAGAAASAGVERIVYLSIFGSHPDSPNGCLASKGRAEEILRSGSIPACVLRVPMVLGPGDHASFALRRQAQQKLLPLVDGGRTLQQPIDARDVVSAIRAALSTREPIAGGLDLGGPECLRHRDLVARAAALHGNRPTVLPIPLFLLRAAIGVIERVSAEPPMTTTMLDVLQHDDRIDTAPALARLGIALTPLAETLAAYVGPDPGLTSGRKRSSRLERESNIEHGETK